MHVFKLNIKRIFFICAVFLLISCDNNKQIKLCSDDLLDELIRAKYVDDREVKKIWEKIRENRYVNESGKDLEVRTKFVKMQFLFESTLSSMIKYGMVKNAMIITHTSYPSTPLRTDGINASMLTPKETIIDPETLNTIVMRHKSLHDYLNREGKLYAVYKKPKKEEDIPGFNIYKQNLGKYYKNLFDVPVNDFDDQYQGASYLVECNNGETILFSISGAQVHDIKNNNWTIYYGSIRSQEVYGHYKALQNLYSKYGLDFDFKV